MTIHVLAELMASCAWPAIARFRETTRTRGALTPHARCACRAWRRRPPAATARTCVSVKPCSSRSRAASPMRWRSSGSRARRSSASASASGVARAARSGPRSRRARSAGFPARRSRPAAARRPQPPVARAARLRRCAPAARRCRRGSTPRAHRPHGPATAPRARRTSPPARRRRSPRRRLAIDRAAQLEPQRRLRARPGARRPASGCRCRCAPPCCPTKAATGVALSGAGSAGNACGSMPAPPSDREAPAGVDAARAQQGEVIRILDQQARRRAPQHRCHQPQRAGVVEPRQAAHPQPRWPQGPASARRRSATARAWRASPPRITGSSPTRCTTSGSSASSTRPIAHADDDLSHRVERRRTDGRSR